MPFKVKATLIAFLGDEGKYGCHFNYKVGDEIVFDGERCIGRVCPALWDLLAPKVTALRNAGPRYKNPSYYAPIFYSPGSVRDPTRKKYDGLGWRPRKEAIVEPPYHMTCLLGPNAFKYPPPQERIAGKDVTVFCGDLRTAALFKLEAFDLSDKGYDISYFRRQMVILSKVLSKQGIEANKILGEFTKEEIEGIHPALISPIMLQTLMEELELMGYLEIRNGRAYVTEKGAAKLEDFKTTLSEEETKALRLETPKS